MTAAANDSTRSRRPRLVDELSEDLDVAIREFLERNPRASARRIRQAIRLVERRTDGGPLRRVAAALVVLAAFAIGVALGLLLG